MNVSVKKSSLLSAAMAAALIALSPVAARGHETHPRSENFRVENEIHISSSGISVFQTQTYRGEFLDKLWNRVDADKDGRFSKKDRRALDENLKNNYTDHTGLRVNWAMAPLVEAATFDPPVLTSRRPKDVNAAEPAKVTFRAVYDYAPSGLDLVELVIPSLNAHEVTCAVYVDPGLRAVRVNAGRIIEAGRRVEDMLQTDGHPDTFSLLIVKEQN